MECAWPDDEELLNENCHSISQPDDVDVNEIVVRPSVQEF
jgi:hypothetical protein